MPQLNPRYSLEWRGLDVVVNQSRFGLRAAAKSSSSSPSQILTDASSGASRGKLVALMGPSGAGKTTLLEALCGRRPTSAGEFFVNGQKTTAKDVQLESTLVPQQDALLGTLTVHETLMYAARLGLPGATRAEMEERVDDILTGLGLVAVRNRKLGTVLQRGLSGGQLRRVSIGCGLVSLAPFLFLDEPTSGLDSTTAFEVVSAIRRVVTSHDLTCIITIHSPSTELFDLFDDVVLLSGGRTVYSGPRAEVIPYLASVDEPCPMYTNPADHMLRLVSTDFDGSEGAGDDVEAAGKRADRLASLWKERSAAVTASTTPDAEDKGSSGDSSSDDIQSMLPVLSLGPESAPATPHVQEKTLALPSTNHSALAVPSDSLRLRKSRTPALIRQSWILTCRSFLSYSRSLLAYGIRLGMYIAIGVVVAVVWGKFTLLDTRINDRLSVHFGPTAFFALMSVAGVPAFLEDRGVMLREQANRLYGPAAFTIANTIVMVAFMTLCTLCSALPTYYGTDLGHGAKPFFQWFLFTWLGVIIAEAMALATAAVLPIFVAALAIASFTQAFWMVLQGFFVKAVNLPRWAYHLHWVDYMALTFNSQVKLDLYGRVFACQGSVVENTCSCAYPGRELIDQGICAVSGRDVLRALRLDGTRPDLYAGLLVLIFLFWRVAFYLALKMRSP